MQFPPEITVSNQRPDIVIWSLSSRQAIMKEITVPWEERIVEACEQKREKYHNLVADCQQCGRKV
jgi:glycerol kinase